MKSGTVVRKCTTATTTCSAGLLSLGSPQQTGPEIFKTARKCGIFGVCCEPLQVNCLIDEAEDVGKGAEATLSLFHHSLLSMFIFTTVSVRIRIIAKYKKTVI